MVKHKVKKATAPAKKPAPPAPKAPVKPTEGVIMTKLDELLAMVEQVPETFVKVEAKVQAWFKEHEEVMAQWVKDHV